MENPAFTMRDLVLKQLDDEFGPSKAAANVHTWSIDVGLGDSYAAVNVRVNCYRTPEDVNIWIFDPHVFKRSEGVRYLKIPSKDNIAEVVKQVRHHLMRTRQRIRRRERQKCQMSSPRQENNAA